MSRTWHARRPQPEYSPPPPGRPRPPKVAIDDPFRVREVPQPRLVVLDGEATARDRARAAAEEFRAAHRERSTRERYDGSWRAWVRWCDQEDLDPLPADPEEVAIYAVHLATTGGRSGTGRKPATVAGHLSAIGAVHTDNGYSPPTHHVAVRQILAGIRRLRGVRPTKVTPMLLEDLTTILEMLDEQISRPTVTDARNRVVLALTACGWSPSQIARAEIDTLELLEGGVRLDRPATRARHDPTPVTLLARDDDLCPLRAVRGWLRRLPYDTGPLVPALSRGNNPTATGEPTTRQAITHVLAQLANDAGLSTSPTAEPDWEFLARRAALEHADPVSGREGLEPEDRLLIVLDAHVTSLEDLAAMDLDDLSATDTRTVPIELGGRTRGTARSSLAALDDEHDPVAAVEARLRAGGTGPLIAGPSGERTSADQLADRLRDLASNAGMDLRAAAGNWRLAALLAVTGAADGVRAAALRDKAILGAGWWSARRRSGIADGVVGHMERHSTLGYSWLSPRSKSDPEGHGHTVDLPAKEGVCDPVAALDEYFELVADSFGELQDEWPLWFATGPGGSRLLARPPNSQQAGDMVGISAGAIHEIVCRRAAEAGLTHDATGRPRVWGSHSLRRGFVTEAVRQGIPLRDIMATTGHADVQTLMEYVEAARLFSDGSAAMRLAHNDD